MEFITVPGLDVFITQTYCDFPFSYLLYHSLVLLCSPPYSVRNILIQILDVLNDATRVYKGGGRIHSQGFLSWYS